MSKKKIVGIKDFTKFVIEEFSFGKDIVFKSFNDMYITSRNALDKEGNRRNGVMCEKGDQWSLISEVVECVIGENEYYGFFSIANAFIGFENSMSIIFTVVNVKNKQIPTDKDVKISRSYIGKGYFRYV